MLAITHSALPTTSQSLNFYYYSYLDVDLQDISELLVSKSAFTENHFTSCTGGGGAISIAVGIANELH